MDFITNLTSYFTSKEIHFPKKVLFVIFISIGFLLIDSVFSFSYYFNNSAKVEQLSKLNQVVTNKTLSVTEVAKVKMLRREIINHKSLLERDLVSIFEIKFKDSRNAWLHFVTANMPLLILAFCLLLLCFIEMKHGMVTILSILLIFEPLILLFCWVVAELLALIPAFNNSIWNYLINLIIGIGVMVSIQLLVNYLERKRPTSK